MKLQLNHRYITRDRLRVVTIDGPGNIAGTWHGHYMGNDEDTHYGTWYSDGHWLSSEVTSKYDLIEEWPQI